MNGSNSILYYAQRVEQALAFAEHAQSTAARDIHLDLACRYSQWLRHARSDRPMLTVVDGGRQGLVRSGKVARLKT